MNIIFWQNLISQQQLPYIKELHKNPHVDKVYLVVPAVVNNQRIGMGWSDTYNQIEGLEVVINPNAQLVDELLMNFIDNSIHFFSGIRGDKFVFNCFKKSLNYKLKRGIITEGPYTYKKPLFLHYLKTLLLDISYLRQVDFVFAFGDKAQNYYQLLRNNWKVFLFGYCVEQHSVEFKSTEENMLKIIFVGSLIKRKNVMLLLKSLANIKNEIPFQLDIVGNGDQEKKLKQFISKENLESNINFLGVKKLEELRVLLNNYNVLVLPSLHDGWGGVINEGLNSGLYILCSDNCGAKTLIENTNKGSVFKSNSVESLTKQIYKIDIQKINKQRKENKEWAHSNLNGSKFANYFVECITEELSPPWKL